VSTDDNHLLSQVGNQQFCTWVTDSAMSKMQLEMEINDIVADDVEVDKLRAAVTIGVTETLIKLKQLVEFHLEDED
jgi:hypothetical protein